MRRRDCVIITRFFFFYLSGSSGWTVEILLHAFVANGPCMPCHWSDSPILTP